MKESDWKCFKRIHKTALKKHCEVTLKHLAKITSEGPDDPHGAYLEAYKYMMKRDKELAEVFNDYRRSTALTQLRFMINMKIVSEVDLEGLSEESRARLQPYEEE